MITQIGEKEALFNFYTDILAYDEDDAEVYTSKEVYAKKVSRFFNTVPKQCTAEQFIRAVYESSVDESLPENKRYPTIALGYVKPGGRMTLFSGDQAEKMVDIDEKDKLIVYTTH